MRVFALSDLHVDHQGNLAWVNQLSSVEYLDDALILAGDVSDRLDRIEEALASLRGKFASVFFVPGNHELWIRKEDLGDSIGKFEQVMSLCESLGVQTFPGKLHSGETTVHIVPLFSWYARPEDGPDSLYLKKKTENTSLQMWGDDRFTRWPQMEESIADYFLGMNRARFPEAGEDVISFSHFLPRRELIFGSEKRSRSGGGGQGDPHPWFNFSRFAGSAGINRQIRELRSVIHVYGHQHRDRNREIDGVQYVSRCLGYRREQIAGFACAIESGPQLIWDSGCTV